MSPQVLVAFQLVLCLFAAFSFGVAAGVHVAFVIDDQFYKRRGRNQ